MKKQTIAKRQFNYWVVYVGKVPGIYSDYRFLREQVEGFNGARFRGYQSLYRAMAAFEQFSGETNIGLSLPFREVKDESEYEDSYALHLDQYMCSHRSYTIRRIEDHRLDYELKELNEYFMFDSYCQIDFQSYTIHSNKLVNPRTLLNAKAFHKRLLSENGRNELGIMCITEHLRNGDDYDGYRVLYFNKIRFDQNFHNKL